MPHETMKLWRKKFLFFQRPLYFYQLSLLIAVELVLAFSALGYVVIQPISITFMTIPVLLGALCFGPFEGMLLGAIFGLTSLWKATLTAVSYGDCVFSPFLSGRPLESLILSLGTRMALGFWAGLLFMAAKHCRRKQAAIFFASMTATFFHSVFVYTALQAFFPEIGITLSHAAAKLTQIGTILNLTSNGALILLLYRLINAKSVQSFARRINQLELSQFSHEMRRPFIRFIVLLIICGIGLLLHFFERMKLLFLREGLPMSEAFSHLLFSLCLQFFVALVALFYIIAVTLSFLGKYSKEMTKRSERDLMTELYNKEFFQHYVDAHLEKLPAKQSCAFMVLDIDDFKSINDSYGHPFGDQVLKEFSKIIQASLHGVPAVIGRIGGDEFAAFLYDDSVTQAALEQHCHLIRAAMYQLRINDGNHAPFACSIGAVYCSCSDAPRGAQLYAKADEALYQSKRRGKATYTILT